MTGPVEEDVLINFVGINSHVGLALLLNHFRDLLKLLPGCYAAGWVGREVEEDQPGPRRDCRGDVRPGKRETRLFFQVDGHGLGADVPGEGFIDGIAGTGVNHLVTGITVSFLAQTDGRLAPGTQRPSAGLPGIPRVFAKCRATASRSDCIPWGSQ